MVMAACKLIRVRVGVGGGKGGREGGREGGGGGPGGRGGGGGGGVYLQSHQHWHRLHYQGVVASVHSSTHLLCRLVFFLLTQRFYRCECQYVSV